MARCDGLVFVLLALFAAGCKNEVNATTQCLGNGHDTESRPGSSPEVQAAALSFFNHHTARGRPRAISEDLEHERHTFTFGNTERRLTGSEAQALIDEMATRWPLSVEVPPVRALHLCDGYDDVFLDLTEDGRYHVLVEISTTTPIYMYRQAYRP